MLSDRARSALAILGRAWMAYHRPRDFHGLVTDYLLVGDDGLYHAEGWPPLAQSEALGVTVVLRWVAMSAPDAIVRETKPQDGGPFWMVSLPGEDEPDVYTAAEALPIVRALQVCWRAWRPKGRPFGPRDPVLEALERAARRMEAALRPPVPAEVLNPYLARSDLGRDWGR